MKSLVSCTTMVVLMVACITLSAASGASAAEFVFSGHSVLSEQLLLDAMPDYGDQSIGDEQLIEIKQAVVNLYVQRGYIASVQVTRQDDQIAVNITESKANVTIADAEAYSESFIKSHFGDIDDKVWRNQDLVEALLILHELPGLSRAKATVSQGEGGPGQTDIRVDLTGQQKNTPFTAVMRLDNFGSPDVSRYRITESFSDSNLTGRGDDLQLQVVHGLDFNDLLYLDLRMCMPISGDGTKLRAYIANGDFEIGRALEVLGLAGSGTSYGLSVTRPLVRSRRQSSTAELGLDISNTKFEMDIGQGIVLGRDRIRKMRLGATWDWCDTAGRSREILSAYLHQGLGEFLDGSTSGDATSRRGASNSFTKLAVQGARQQRLDERATLNFRLSGQAATTSLLTGEQFSIGGADSVRGYPQSEFLGDDGLQASVDLRYSPRGATSIEDGPDWIQALNLVAFVDYGTIFGDASIAGAGIGFLAELGDSSPSAARFLVRCDLGYALSSQHPTAGGRLQPYFRIEHRF